MMVGSAKRKGREATQRAGGGIGAEVHRRDVRRVAGAQGAVAIGIAEVGHNLHGVIALGRAIAPPLSWTPLQCNSALDLYSAAAEFGTVATRPPRRTTAVVASAVGLLKSRMAVPGVDAASSDSEAPVSAVLTRGAGDAEQSGVVVQREYAGGHAAADAEVERNAVGDVVGQVDRIGAVRPAGESGDADDDRRGGDHEGGDVVAAGGVAAVGAVERDAKESP